MKDKFFESINQNKWLLLILLLALFLRFFHLDYQSLWLDEIYTLNVSSPKLTFKQFHKELIDREGFPHLYFILLKIFYFFFGYTPFVARSFSAIVGVLSVYGIYLLGKELINQRAGLIVAFLLACNEYNVVISQDARPYTLYLLFTILSFYRLSKFIKEPSLRNAVLFGVFSGLIVNANFFGFINLFSQALIILFYLFLKPKQERFTYLKNAFISGIIALLLFLPNYQMLVKLLNFKSFWVPKPEENSFSSLFKEFLGNSELTMFIFLPLFIFYLIKVFNDKGDLSIKDDKKNEVVFSFTLLFGWAFIFILFLLIKSYTDVSLILTRYFTSIIPVFFLVIGFGISMIKNKIVRGIVIFSLGVLTLTNLVVIKNYYKRIGKSQFREASAFIIENNKNKETVYTSLKYWFDFYLNNETVKTNVAELPLENLVQEMMADPSKVKAFWYVDAHGRAYTISDQAKKFLSDNFYVENNFDGMDAWTKHYILLKDAPKTVDISKFLPLKDKNGDDFALNLELFENANNIVKANGWVYFDKQDATKTVIDILLIKDGIAQRMVTARVLRPDVTDYFKNGFDLSNAGFMSTLDLSTLQPGKYQMGIYLKNPETKKEGLVLTDKFVEKN